MHCMHPESGTSSEDQSDHRVCCWCGFRQERFYTDAPGHGSFVVVQQWTWMPRQDSVACSAHTTSVRMTSAAS